MGDRSLLRSFGLAFLVPTALVLALLLTPLRQVTVVIPFMAWMLMGQGGWLGLAFLLVLSGWPLIWTFTIPRGLIRLAADPAATKARWRTEAPRRAAETAGLVASLLACTPIVTRVLGVSLP